MARPLAAMGLRLNPAMAAYATLLLLFPQAMSRWCAPADLAGAQSSLAAALHALAASLGLLDATALDAMTMATPLDLLRLDDTHTLAELRRLHPQLDGWGGHGWSAANAGFLAGGLWLVWRRVIAWHAPAAFLATLALLAALFHDGGSSASGGPPLLHLFAGGTMLAAFFILTDPVSAARTTTARLACGALTGTLVFTMRLRGDYADGIAFAVLLTGLAAPLFEWPAPVRASLARLQPLPAAPARAVIAVLLGAALLSLDWLGLRGAPPAGDLPLGEVLSGIAYDNRPAEDRVAVQDLALLGLTTPRDAFRARQRGEIVAVALPVIAADGYGGPIELLLGIRSDGRLNTVRVLRHAETPGYGDAIETRKGDWIRGFDGRSLDPPTRWSLRRDGGDFDQFTGATTTPRAVVGAVHRGLQYFAAHRAQLLQDAPP
jgi:RnfABCDGE-type electron transport complex G subunit